MRLEKSDVLIIGSGGAGLRAAIELSDSGKDVIVVGKSEKRNAHTILATGGINASLATMDSADSWKTHAADTIRDGCFINDTDAVITLCKNANRAVNELAKWGTKFHREKNGKISQRFFGAATYRRACFVGDHTGREILNTLVDQVEKRKMRFNAETYIFSLLFDEKNNEVYGALGIENKTGELIIFHSKAVILATGGHSRMYSRSSSRFWENNGDGISLAYDCKADFRDMEMFQFHPSGMLYPAKAEGVLVTEAIRGEGGILLNNKGERFMLRYDKGRMELSARDVVARAIYQEVKEGRGTKRGGVYLDITHRPKKYILKRLPKMYEQFKKYAGIDISKQKMEIAPTAHYSMGGIYTNTKGETSINGLYAVGEVTSGTHGANRLGGNSLAELIVFGRIVAENINNKLKNIKKWHELGMPFVDQQISDLTGLMHSKGRDPIEIKKEIQKMMWKHAGVVRNAKELKKALKEIERYEKMKFKVAAELKMNEKLIAALDVKNMIPTCKMILLSALYRKESRGAHYRSDYSKTSNEYKCNIICQPTDKSIKISKMKIKAVPKDIKKIIENTQKAVARLLE